jgi:hypothetical protein
MWLRAAAFVPGQRSNLRIVEGIASGEEQVRPRNDMIRWRVWELHFHGQASTSHRPFALLLLRFGQFQAMPYEVLI